MRIDVFRTVTVLVLILANLPGAIAAQARQDEPWHTYLTALAQSCPAKHLEQLSPADLRDTLDAFKATIPMTAQQAAERQQGRSCLQTIAGASCDNLADMRALVADGRLSGLTQWVCGSFQFCAGPSQCEPILAKPLVEQLHTLNAAAVVSSLSDSAWGIANAQAAAGQADWLEALLLLRPATDGARTEGIDQAISAALATHPSAVFTSLAAHSGLPPVEWFCQDRRIDVSSADSRARMHAALAAVSAVNSVALTPMRDRCMVRLRDAIGRSGQARP